MSKFEDVEIEIGLSLLRMTAERVLRHESSTDRWLEYLADTPDTPGEEFDTASAISMLGMCVVNDTVMDACVLAVEKADE
jgi:hypothetical protein